MGLRVTRHGDHLVQLTRWGAINCYLVREDDGLTLIDTGVTGTTKGILAATAAEGGGAIRRILLTHSHGDHAGSLDALRAELGDVEVGVGTREARLLAGDRALDPDEAPSKLRGGFVKASPPTRPLEPGDRVGSLETVAAPGHTPGHLAFLDTRDRTLIAGDAFQTLGGIAVAGVLRPLFPLPALATWDKPTARRSGAALLALTPARLAVGHGRVLEDPVPAMESALAAAG